MKYQLKAENQWSLTPLIFDPIDFKGGLSIKAGAADSVKKQAENLNAGNSKTNLGGVDQAISNIAADAVSQYYYDEQLKDMGYAMDAAAKSEHAAYRLEQAKRLNLETLATDTGEQFRQSGIGLKPYVSGASISNWDVAGDRAAVAQQKRTADTLGLIYFGPNAVGGLGIAAAPVLGATTLSPILTTSVSIKSLAIASSVSATINGSINAGQQYYKYGEIKYPAELVISTAMGSLEGPVGAYGGVFFNGIVGASSNAITATIVNDYYNYDIDHNGEIYKTTAVGFGFGVGGKYADDKYISPFLSKYFKF